MKFQKFVGVMVAVAFMTFGAVSPAVADDHGSEENNHGSAANTVTTAYTFGTQLTGSGPATASFANMLVTTSDYKTFVFDLTVGNNLNSVFNSSGTFVSGLRVNTISGNDPTSVAINSGNWGVSTVKLSTKNNNTGGISWDFQDSFCGSGESCSANKASSRLTAGEEVKWSTTFNTAQSFDTPPFLLKVQGIGGGGSAEYLATVSAVPEPDTYAMLLAGLGLIGFTARRRWMSK